LPESELSKNVEIEPSKESLLLNAIIRADVKSSQESLKSPSYYEKKRNKKKERKQEENKRYKLNLDSPTKKSIKTTR
jgi:hypothetical protein